MLGPLTLEDCANCGALNSAAMSLQLTTATTLTAWLSCICKMAEVALSRSSIDFPPFIHG